MKQPGNSAEHVISHLTSSQRWLRTYIFTLLGDEHAADDVLQSTNLVIWRKAGEFVEGTDFVRWACTIARYEVSAYYRMRGRDRRLLDEETLFRLAERAEGYCEKLETRLAALRECERKLNPEQWELLRQRYGFDCPSRSVAEIARRRNETVPAVASALYRIRRALFHCIRRQLKESVP